MDNNNNGALARAHHAIGNILALIALCFAALPASAVNVQWSGFATLGDHSAVKKNYPWTAELMEEKSADGFSSVLDQALRERVLAVENPSFHLVAPGTGSPSRNGEPHVAVAFALDRESVSVEKVGDVWKLMVTLSAQALFVDFRRVRKPDGTEGAETTLLGSWPSVVRYTDVKRQPPSDKDKRAIVRNLYLGKLGVNIFDDFSASLSTLALNAEVGNRVQVRSVTIGDDTRPSLPAQYSSDEEGLKAMVAREFNKALSVNQKIPVLPYMAGYSAAVQGRMAVTFADGSMQIASIPEADYEIDLTLNNLRKIELSKTPGVTTWVYGSYLGIKVTEPLGGIVDATIKNGATLQVPNSQGSTDDWAAFQESLLILMDKFTRALDAPTAQWAEQYAGDKTLVPKLQKLHKVLQTCR